MISLKSFVNWKEADINVNLILAKMVSPTQNDAVEWNGDVHLYQDENLEELFRDLGLELIEAGFNQDPSIMEKAKQEPVSTFVIVKDEELSLRVEAIYEPNRFDSDTPELLINFNEITVIEK